MRLIVLIGVAGGLGAVLVHDAVPRARGGFTARAVSSHGVTQDAPANHAHSNQAHSNQAPADRGSGSSNSRPNTATAFAADPYPAGFSSSAPGETVASLDDLPLEPGATWAYRTFDTIDNGDQGTGDQATGDQGTGGQGIEEQRGTLLVKTLAVHRHGDLTVATLLTERRVNGASDSRISWQVIQGKSGSADGAGTPSSRAAQTAFLHAVAESNRLRQILDLGPTALSESDADLAFPIRTGGEWGDPRLASRGDGLYVNRVEAPQDLDLPAGRLKAWPIVFATLPERITSWFAPGVGIVRYEYAHHGSLNRESYELVEFRRGAPDSLALVQYLDGLIHRLTDYPDFWPVRASLADDPELRALLGPLSVITSGEMPDGSRRHLLQADRTQLSFIQLPDAAGRGVRVEWRNAAGAIHVFGAVEPRGGHASVRGS